MNKISEELIYKYIEELRNQNLELDVQVKNLNYTLKQLLKIVKVESKVRTVVRSSVETEVIYLYDNQIHTKVLGINNVTIIFENNRYIDFKAGSFASPSYYRFDKQNEALIGITDLKLKEKIENE